MRFWIKNSNLFLLPNNPHMLHVATIGYSLREYIAMLCIKGPHSGKCYIEEIVLNSIDYSKDVFANCKFIDDDNLANDLTQFIQQKGLLDIKGRLEELRATGNLKWLLGNQDLKTLSLK